jgi:hypothetical protein
VTFARLPRLRGIRGTRGLPRLPEPPPLPAAEQFENDALRTLELRIGDAALAKRVQRLQAQHPVGSVPELIVLDWLVRNNWSHLYQHSLFGGRSLRGGLLPDFVVFVGGSASVWQVQGEYWHSVKLKGDKDRNVNLRMLGQWVDGARIESVVEMWEEDIYRKRPQIFYMALAGIGLRA